MQLFSNVWYWVISLVVALAYAGGLYYKNRRDELETGWRVFLACLRFGFVFFMCFLLFSPLVKVKQERIEKPLCFLAVDHSASMGEAADSALLASNIRNFSEKLSKNFNVKTVAFGLVADENADFCFNRPATDLSQVFEYLNRQTSANSNAVLVLVSDGNNNVGQNPLSASRKLALPLYTVGTGDTTLYPDIFIEEVLSNRYTYKGNYFPLHIRIGQNRAPQAQARLLLRSPQNTILHDTTIHFQGHQEVSVEWNTRADSAGIYRYQLVLESRQKEHNTKNNQKAILVNVLENRQKILLLANSAHPDISCLRQSLQTQEKYQVDVVLANQLNRQIPVESYDLIILHGLPSRLYPLQQIQAVLEQKPLFYLLSGSTALSLLKEEKTGVQLRLRGNQWNEAQARFNPDFGLFNISAQERNLFEKWPPLQTPFALYNTLSGGQALFTQNVSGISTGEPLIWIGPQNEHRSAFCFGTHLWKWRLATFQENGNTETFDLLLDKCIQLLCQPKPTDNLTVICPNLLYTTQKLSVQAQLFNAAFENVPDAAIHFKLTEQQSQTEYTFDFVPANDRYVLDAGFLPEGKYRYTAKATVGTETYLAQGSVEITDRQMENSGLPANIRLLKNLALNGGGSFFYAGPKGKENTEVWDALRQELQQRKDLKPVIKAEESYVLPLNRQWILILLLSLLCLEYFARKRFGNL